MKILRLFSLLAIVALAFFASACLRDECEAEHSYVRYDPVFIQPAVLRAKIAMGSPQKIRQAGKIYLYGQYLFVNDFEKGIHIFDNQDPASPRAIGYLDIPGNVDMAVRNQYLYADSYVDLVTFDLSRPDNPVMVNRLEDVFPQYGWDEARGLLVDYEPTRVEEKMPCSNAGKDVIFINGGMWVRKEVAVVLGSNAGVPGTSGIGGSTARFTLGFEQLYTVNESSLKVFSLSVPESPKLANTVRIGWGIETIFPFKDKLFIGSRTGMFIYDASDPLNPRQLSVFQHASACDPVVAEGNTAYVTLRGGTQCENFTNQLEVIDISDLLKPRLLKVYPMHHPIGLSVVKGTLFICEDDAGLKVFDATEWDKIDQRLLDHEKGLTTFDVIALEKPTIAIVTAKEGIFQYDYSDPKNLRLLSKISVEEN